MYVVQHPITVRTVCTLYSGRLCWYNVWFYPWFSRILSHWDSLHLEYESSRWESASQCKAYVTKHVHDIFGKIAYRNEWNGHTFVVVDEKCTGKTTQFKGIQKQKQKYWCNHLHLTIASALLNIAKIKHFVMFHWVSSWSWSSNSIVLFLSLAISLCNYSPTVLETEIWQELRDNILHILQ